MAELVQASIPGLLRSVLTGVLRGQSVGEAIDSLELDPAYESAVLAWIVEESLHTSTINASDLIRGALRRCEAETK